MSKRTEAHRIAEPTELEQLHEAYKAIDAEVTVVRLRYDGVCRRRSAALDKLRAVCPHTESVESSSYFSGSYYDKASTSYVWHCKLCGVKTGEKTEMHSYYG